MIEWGEASKKYNINKWKLYRYIRDGKVKKLGYKEKLITHKARNKIVSQIVKVLIINEKDIKKLPIEILKKNKINIKPLKVIF